MAETLSELVVRITADANELKKSLGESEKGVSKLGKKTEKETKSIKDNFLAIGTAATVMGASIVASMTKTIMSFTKTGSELNDLSLKTGVSVKALAGLKYAAEQNGASLATVNAAIRRMSTAMQDAKDGLAETKRAFDRMGVSLQELEGLKPEEQFLKIAGAIAEIPDPMTRAATAQDLFGRSGMDMLPMLSQGAAGLKKMMEEGVKLSGWTEEGAALADEFGDAIDTLKTAMSGISNTIGAALAPALKGIANALTGIVSTIKSWMDVSPELTKAISTAAIVVGVFATAVGVASLAVKYLGTMINLQFGGVLLIIGAVVTGIVLLIDWFNRAGAASRKLAEENKIALEKQKADTTTYYAKKKADITSDYDNTIKKLREEYGVTESLTKSKMDLARDLSEANKRALDEQLRKSREAHNEAISQLNERYSVTIRLLDLESGGMLSQLQDQIDAIDKQTSVEDRGIRERERTSRLAELQRVADSAKTSDEAMRAYKDRDDYILQINRERLLEQRSDEKDTLRVEMDRIRTWVQAEKDRLATELKDNIETKNAIMKAFELDTEVEKMALDTALTEELKRLETVRLQKEADAKTSYDNLVTSLDKEAGANQEHINKLLKQWEQYSKDLANVQQYSKFEQWIGGMTGVIPKPVAPMGQYGDIEDILELRAQKYTGDYLTEEGFIGRMKEGTPYAKGGIVTQATTALVGEAGPEAIIPLDEGIMGGITLNFTQPVFFDREDTMNKFVRMLNRGIQRQERLRFGVPYRG